jgi:8-oxo-dGTP pyrophosphatase MutT (NUDIX family)|tara:strand:+ start:349 stop:780 length:432 start_codon:yes stop_codon:yes gene_type:complete
MAKQILKAAVHTLILDGNNVLLSKRKNTGFCDGMYSLPAGHVDDLEHASQAMIRELQEEVNIITTADQLTCVLTGHNLVNDNPYVCFYYTLVNYNKREIFNNEPEKCESLDWFDLDDLPDNMVDYVRKAIDAYLDGAIYIETK